MLDETSWTVAGHQHSQLTRPDETSRDDTKPAETPRDPADDYWQLTGKYPSQKITAWIDDLAGTYGVDAVTRHLAEQHRVDADGRTLMGRVSDGLRSEARHLTRSERERELARVAESRKSGAAVQMLISRHNNGQHEATPVEACPSCQRSAT